MADTPLPFTTRLWFAWACFFRILFDGAFAARAWEVRESSSKRPTLPPAPPPPPILEPVRPAAGTTPTGKTVPPTSTALVVPAPPEPTTSTTPALQLLALLQREGRLIDFLEQDIETFSDADIGAAVRVVHEGCRKTLRAHAKLAPVRTEEEGAAITLEEGFKPAEIKLSGNVTGTPPYKGTLRHRGWRATSLTLPTPVKGHEPEILAPAEVEL